MSFGAHLGDLVSSGEPAANSWAFLCLSDLEWVVSMPARKADGTKDWYFIKLGLQYYDLGPPETTFVTPVDWSPVGGGRWFPQLQPPPWFGLHASYSFPNAEPGQLVCFSLTAGYYRSNHAPEEGQRWRKGYHNFSATLRRLQEVLSPPYYLQPSGGCCS